MACNEFPRPVVGLSPSSKGLLPRSGAKPAAERALVQVEKFAVALGLPWTELQLEEIRHPLEDIADDYFIDRENYAAIRGTTTPRETAAVRNAAMALQKSIGMLSKGGRLALNTDAVRGLHNDPLVSVLARIEGDLNTIVERANAIMTGELQPSVPPMPTGQTATPIEQHLTLRSGPIRMAHVARATTRLVRVWETLGGQPFSGTIRETSSGAQEFGEIGPQFVHNVLRAIDPEIRFAAVRTALRAAVKITKGT